MLPKSIPKIKYQLQFTEGAGDKRYDWINMKFTLHDVICLISCATLGTLYLYSKVIFFFKFINMLLLKLLILFYFSTGLQTIYLDWHLL